MAGYDLKSSEEIQEYLKNLHIEYQFGCLNEKKPEGNEIINDSNLIFYNILCFWIVCHLLGDYNESIKQDSKEAIKIYKNNCDEFNYGRSCTKYGDYKVIGK